MHQRVLPVSVGGSGAMTHEMCAEFGAAANFTGDGVVYGVEYGEQCWVGNLSKSAQKLNNSECEAIPCGGNPKQACGGPYKIQAFTATCEEVAMQPVLLSAARSGSNTTSLSTVNVHSRLIEGAWNILRVLVEDDRLRVWLNPSFADVTGASIPPADEVKPPKQPSPLLDGSLICTTASQGGRMLSAKAVGQWRLDYASVLPNRHIKTDDNEMGGIVRI
jgi:hypothetical protein